MSAAAGISKELQQGDRDSNKESKILLWIYACLDEVSNTDYDQYLKDGVALCHLMNFLQPGAVPGAIESGTDHKTKRVNIVHFLRAVQAYGVPRDLLFEPEDLLYLRHVPKVTRCLYALGKAAESKPEYTGPKLGEEPDDPLNMATQRRAGMPVGDDIYVAHVDIRSKIKRLKQQEEGHVPAPKTLSLYR
ncbi:myophilin [Galendromus occidentalis]|uniref:Myophilin n=1 Tax=Galendromus occidentalis TaxID=34638 RepID=A0AAJ6QV72_9ACAR|nr:myophilin [Galendromus occidentalis]